MKGDPPRWQRVDFPLFIGVRRKGGPWETVFLRPTGERVDLTRFTALVDLRRDGIYPRRGMRS